MPQTRERIWSTDRSHDLTLPADPTAPAAARAHVVEALTAEGADPQAVDEAVLLVDEIVTDVVGGGVAERIEVRVFVTLRGWAVVVEWPDPEPGTPAGREYLPLQGTDPAARLRRELVDNSGLRWWICDDGLRTTVGIELPGLVGGARP